MVCPNLNAYSNTKCTYWIKTLYFSMEFLYSKMVHFTPASCNYNVFISDRDPKIPEEHVAHWLPWH